MTRYAAATTTQEFSVELFEKGKNPSGTPLNVEVDTDEGNAVVNLGEKVGWPNLYWKRVSADLYSVLMEKMIGEYLTQVVNCSGNGVKALHAVHRWCT